MQVKFLKSLTKLEDIPMGEKPQVAFVGRSNVGKSSLINHLCNQKNLARVSAEPGRTRTINLFDVDGKYWLVDLPGYGFAKASKEKRMEFSDMLDNYLTQANRLKLVFLIIDARIGPTDLDRDMLGFLKSGDVRTFLILNKVDKLKNSELTSLMRTIEAGYPGIDMIPHSSISGTGRTEILEALDKAK